MSAAALSAAVDSYNFNGEHTHFQAEPILQKNYPQRQPLSGREREGEAFLRKAASLALPHQSSTRFTAGEEEDDEEG